MREVTMENNGGERRYKINASTEINEINTINIFFMSSPKSISAYIDKIYKP